MYFSNEDSQNIAHYDELSNSLLINRGLYVRLLFDWQQNMRVLLDTQLLRFFLNENMEKRTDNKLVPKSKASFHLGTHPPQAIINYITNAAMKAEFKELSNAEFKECYLAPLDNALRRVKLDYCELLPVYKHPIRNSVANEGDIQEYYDRRVTPPLAMLYRSINGDGSRFRNQALFRAPNYKSKFIGPDIAHYLMSSDNGPRYLFCPR